MARRAFGVGAFLFGLATPAAAHPGHGLVAQGWLHWATEPVHAAPLGIVALALVLAVRRRARARVPTD